MDACIGEGIRAMACFNDFILLLKYVQEKRFVFLQITYLMDGPILIFLECDAYVIWVLLIILLISVINSNNIFFEKKNLILILIILMSFGALKNDTLTEIQLSIKDNENREKSFSARTV